MTRRRRGLLPLAAGAFLVMVAIAIPFWLVPRLEKAPEDPATTTVLVAKDATVLDVDSQRPLTTDLTLTTRVDAWRGGDPVPDGVVSWQANSTITSADGLVRGETWEVMAFDATSGLASECCEDFRVDETGRSVPVTRQGQVLKFPFRTQAEDIEVWDAALGAAVWARFEGEEDVDGVRAFRFATSVPASEVGTLEVPAPLVGVASIQPVEVTKIYQGARTVWVEPITGGILDVTQRVRQSLRHEGQEVVALAGTFRLTEESRMRAVEQLERGALLGPLRTRVPWAVAGAGLLLLGLGAWRRRLTGPDAR